MKTEERKTENGSIILETGLVLPIFILVFLFVYGLFFVVSAQNQVTSAVFQSMKSLSLDPYLTENVESVQKASSLWSNLGEIILDVGRASNNKYFSSATDWYASGSGALQTVARDRFIGFFAGGKEAEARKKAKNLGIVGGLDGIAITAAVSGNSMTITVNYTIQTWFDAFGLGKIPVSQTFQANLWGVKEDD